MKLSDIFMTCLVLNACRDMDAFSHIIFACALVCVCVRVLQMRGAKND